MTSHALSGGSFPPRGRHISFPGSLSGAESAPQLEGRLSLPSDGTMHPGVVLCHANPAAGGNIDMKVIQAIEAELARRGFATLSYNSRGVGKSEGQISMLGGKRMVGAESEPETSDVDAALQFLARQEGVNGERLALVGHSFGARISLAHLAAHRDDTRVQAVACIGLPVAWRDLSHLGNWPRPKLFVTGEQDDFSPPELMAEFVEELPEPSTRITLKRTGHFFEGREEDLAGVVGEFLSRVFA